ncbi:MAG: cyclic 2,3-diphosphoglycerate synthase [Anaerolineales bacterium]|jgi:predicted GTPase
MHRKRVLILGAAGRDFHNFNVFFRDNPEFEVVAFTATQIPNIEGRRYPAALAGEDYPEGIPIHPEQELEKLIEELDIEQAVFAYSDVSHEYVMHIASRILASGADFRIMGSGTTQLDSTKPVVAVCAARTGSGKSQTSRYIADKLIEIGHRVVVVRHPMPYGDLEKQAVQRFETYADLDKNECTIEEREEYEPHIDRGIIVYAGVDYEKILRKAEDDADVILWDGGNNDLPFYKPDFHLVIVDPHRPGHELSYHPGEANVRSADVVLINKVDTAGAEAIMQVRDNVAMLNPGATIIEAASPIFLEDPQSIRGKRVLVVEDGPTLTHGGMAFGAGWVAARRFGAAEIIDPRPFAVGSIQDTYAKYPTTGNVLPAMGYGKKQIHELEQTIAASNAELIIIGTPIDLTRLMKIKQPSERVRYELEVIGQPGLDPILIEKFPKS